MLFMVTKPYIGVTGLVSHREIFEVHNEFEDAGYGLDAKHVPMMGFLVSYKTLNGQLTQNRRYPKFKDLRSLLESVPPEVMPMIHYNSRELHTLPEQIEQVFTNFYKDYLCMDVQLNIPWPYTAHVRKIKDKFPEMKIAIQLSQKAMEDLSLIGIADRFSTYGKDIDYALIDPSGGRGLDFNLGKSIMIYKELRNSFPWLVVGFAGGLTGENVESKARSIISSVNEDNFCIDAEGGLRDKVTDEYGDDTLNFEKVRAYIRAASSALE